MSGWASPAVNSWTSDPALRFRFCFVDDLTYAPKSTQHTMPHPPPRPSSVPPAETPFEPSDHLRFLVSSPRTSRSEVEHRLHLLKMSLPRLKGEQQRKQVMGDIAFLQCVLDKFASGFAPESNGHLGISPPKSPGLKAFILHHKHRAEKGTASGRSSPEGPVTPDLRLGEARDVSCCSDVRA